MMRVLYDSMAIGGKGVLEEAFGEAKGYKYAVKIDGVDGKRYINSFKEQVAKKSIVDKFLRNARKGYVDAKGKSTMAAVKRWVKENNPSQYYAKWREGAGYKDDVIEIYYAP